MKKWYTQPPPWAFRDQGPDSQTIFGKSHLMSTFEVQILPNFGQLWIIVQHTLLDIHFMILLEEVTHPKFLTN